MSPKLQKELLDNFMAPITLKLQQARSRLQEKLLQQNIQKEDIMDLLKYITPLLPVIIEDALKTDPDKIADEHLRKAYISIQPILSNPELIEGIRAAIPPLAKYLTKKSTKPGDTVSETQSTGVVGNLLNKLTGKKGKPEKTKGESIIEQLALIKEALKDPEVVALLKAEQVTKTIGVPSAVL